MADETSHEQTPELDGSATPNRDRRYEPPVIEGEVADVEAVTNAALRADAAEETSYRNVEEPVASPPSTNGSRSLLSAVIGAIVGAVVAAAAIWLAGRPSAVDPQLAARLESLEKNHPATADAVGALDKRVGALEAASGAQEKAPAYAQRIAALESAALSAKAVADANKDALAQAQAARADAARALALASSGAHDSNETPPPAVSTGGVISADVGVLEGRVAKLEAKTTTPDVRPSDLDPFNQRLDKLETALAAPKSETRAPAEPVSAGRDWAALAVVAQALGDRLRSGAPFALEQAALTHLGADPAKLSDLKSLADKGAPSAGALTADFEKTSPAILAAVKPPDGDGVVDRLLAHMSRAVRITPVGETAGDDPAALVSQIDAALGRGQLAAALTIWERLPESGKQVSMDWAGAAQARIAADKAAQGILNDAMTRLAAANN
jgi:hypothetical protein